MAFFSKIYNFFLHFLYRRILLIFNIDYITGLKIKPNVKKVLLGTLYGGWVIPRDTINKNSICYCAGCGEDISFDLALISEYGCQVYAFDPTPKAIAYVNIAASGEENYHFSPLGLWSGRDKIKFFSPANPNHVSHSALNIQKTDSYFVAEVDSLSNIMRLNKHKELAILKMDIEGAEYKVIEDIVNSRLEIDIICVEFDECCNPLDADYRGRVRAACQLLLGLGYELIDAQARGNYTFTKI